MLAEFIYLTLWFLEEFASGLVAAVTAAIVFRLSKKSAIEEMGRMGRNGR